MLQASDFNNLLSWSFNHKVSYRLDHKMKRTILELQGFFSLQNKYQNIRIRKELKQLLLKKIFKFRELLLPL